MIAVLSDTHGTDAARLSGRAREAVAAADHVIHAGDFTTAAVLDAFRDASARLHAVHGNRDDEAVRGRLGDALTVEVGGVRIAVTHTRRGGSQALSLFGRERGADLVVFGHSHRPGFQAGSDPPLLNPGSHAQPRGNPASHAELEPDGSGGLRGEIRDRDGAVVERVAVPGSATGPDPATGPDDG